jgi:hypothetical protein
MDKTDHLMAEKNENNKDSQKGQKKFLKDSNLRFLDGALLVEFINSSWIRQNQEKLHKKGLC